MTTKDVVLLLLGGAVGAVFNAWFDRGVGAAARLIEKLHRRRRRRQSSLSIRTVEWYARRARHARLYAPVTVGSNLTVPAIVHDYQGAAQRIDPAKNDIITLDCNAVHEFPYNKRYIRFQQRAGVKLFNGEILYVRSKEHTDVGSVRFHLGRTRYFAYSTLAMQLQRELRSRRRSSWRRREHLLALSPFGDAELEPQAAGCSCITVFEVGDGRRVIPISHRSREVANSPGMKAPIPSFGLESNAQEHERSRFEIFHYNFIREFAEELLDVEEVTEMTATSRTHPDWMLTLPPVRSVAMQADHGDLVLTCLGVSANPYDGALDFALVAHFTSPSFYRSIRQEVRANWESRRSEAGAHSIDFIDPFDSQLDRWADEGLIDNCSIVALDLARRRLTAGSSTAVPGPSGTAPGRP